MDFFKIIKQSYDLTFKNKFLWFFGFFSISYMGINSFGNTSNYEVDKADLTSLQSSFPALYQIINFFKENSEATIVIGALLFLFCLIMFVVGIISQASLIISADKGSRQEQISFWTAWRAGAKHFWRLALLYLLQIVLLLVPMLFLGFIIIILMFLQQNFLAILLGLIFLVVYFLWFFTLSMIFPYSFRFLVLSENGIIESLRNSAKLLFNKLGQILVFYLLNYALIFLFYIGVFVAAVLVGAIFTAIGYGLYLVSGLVAGLYTAIIVIASLSVLFAALGFLGAFISNNMTLFFKGLLTSN